MPADQESFKAVDTPDAKRSSDACAVPAPQPTSLPPEAIAATTANAVAVEPAPAQAQPSSPAEAPAGQ
jgi:hypothetical protein